ncbi:MAG: family 1 glycosylhydrolase, partial [Coprobacillus sp.]
MLQLKSYKDITFPEDFLWGAATAGMQIEGNNCSYHDNPETAPKFAYGGVPYQMAGKACNSYELYEDDIQLLKDMNLVAYRMSIEWSRIEPKEGHFDEESIQHYVTVLKRLKEENIKVILTLHHVSHPVWFHKKDAFKTMDNLSVWERYIHKVIPIYKDYVDYFIVLNELNICFEYSEVERINMLQYHARGYHIIKEYCDKPVSSSLSFSFKEPFRGKFDYPDKVLADYLDFTENEFFIHAIKTGEIIMPFHDSIYMPKLKGTCDFWALNTYVRQLINSRSKDVRFDYYNATHFDALEQPFFSDEICPEIILKMLLRFNDRP